MQREIPSPIQGYDDMAGWPGTIPPRRLRELLEVVRSGKFPTEGNTEQQRQMVSDLVNILQANEVNAQPSRQRPFWAAGGDSQEEQHEASLRAWERMTREAVENDRPHTIGGLIVWKSRHTETEDRAVFQLMRDPEWIGLNRILPLMEGMMVALMESGRQSGEAGVIMAQNEWDDSKRTWALGQDLSPAEHEPLARVLRWHGAAEIRWISRQDMLEL